MYCGITVCFVEEIKMEQLKASLILKEPEVNLLLDSLKINLTLPKVCTTLYFAGSLFSNF